MADRRESPGSRRIVGPLLLLLFCLFAWGALLSFDAGDWPSPCQYPHHDPARNACGRAGSLVAYLALHYVGDGVYPLILFATMGAGLWLVHGYIRDLLQRVCGLVLLTVGTAATVHLISAPGVGSLPAGDGGIVGRAIGDLLTEHFSGLGTALILAWGSFIGLLFAAEGWVLRLPDAVNRMRRASGEAIAAVRAPDAGRPKLVPVGSSANEVRGRVERPEHREPPEPPINVHHARSKGRNDDDPRQGKLFRKSDEAEDVTVRAPQPPKPTVDAASPSRGPKPSLTADDSVADERDAVARALHDRRAPAPAEAYPPELHEWDFPPATLLDEPEYSFTSQQEALVRAKAKTLEGTLDEFRVDARVVQIDTGPVITMFELALAPGVKVSQVAALSNDVARALRAPAVRVVAPLPGKNTIGVEVPNIEKEVVRLKELMSLAGAKAAKMGLPLFLGKDASGAALVADLTGMPHLLIAGTTGSGKSVCINSIITSILMTKRPDNVKLILVDPKMVELSQFKEVPHLMCPIVTDMQRAESILEWAVTKMDERYELLAEARVRNVVAFNALTREEIYERFEPTSDDERARIPTRLPYIVVIIDELADLMMTSAKEVEHHLSRLAQKSRAVGIHIVVATQRPEVKVVTGLIKSNLPCRIAFRVASRMDSRIVLDQNGAEVLMGQGDMLFLPPGSSKLIRAQGTFVGDVELHRVIQWLRDRAEPQFHPELLRMRIGNVGLSDERDALFDDAVRIVLETKRGSVSLLQRRLGVGYARASRLIEEMAAAGIVGDYKGSQAREVTITLDEYEDLISRAADDGDEDAESAPNREDQEAAARHDAHADDDD